MIEQACREMGLDPSRSFTVGDRWIDIACGGAAGTRAILVRTGHGAHEAETPRRALSGRASRGEAAGIHRHEPTMTPALHNCSCLWIPAACHAGRRLPQAGARQGLCLPTLALLLRVVASS